MKARELLRELLGIFLLGTALFVIISVLSFSAHDLPGRTAPARAEVANWGGDLGASLSGFLLTWVGTLGSLVGAFFLLHFGWGCLQRRRGEAEAEPPRRVEPLRRLAGALVMVLVLAGLERLLAGHGWAGLGRGLHAGGYWGIFLESGASAHLGGAGASLALTVALGFGFVLATDRPLSVLLAQVGRARELATRSLTAAEETLARAAPTPAEQPPAQPKTEDQELAELLRSVDPPEEVPEAPLASEEDATPKPSVELLTPAEKKKTLSREDDRAGRIEETLSQFKLSAKVVSVEHGPSVSLFALELGKGVKVQRLTGLLDNLAIALRVPGIRLQAPIPGTSYVGLEVPREEPEIVRFRELLEETTWREKSPALPLFLGKDSAGHPLIADLAKMPHLLIAGATGSGKSVCINSIILSLLMTRSSREVQLILIDPKQVELSQFQKVPHLLHPVVTDMRRAGAVLAWAVNKMEERYSWLAAAGVRHIREYNALGRARLAERMDLTERGLRDKKIPWKLPYVVLVVDELNDLMMIAQKEVEASITRLAQKSRAVGVHVVLATQRPSVDVLTGVIKSNLPARIAFRVASKVDSRTILDMSGADKLLGQGDMLFLPPNRTQPIRALGALVTEKEIRQVVKATTRRARAEFDADLVAATDAALTGSGRMARVAESPSDDPSYDSAVRVVLANGKGSVSLIQRKLKLGYARAARLLDLMADEGIVGPARGSKARELQTTLEEWETKKTGNSNRE